MSLGDKLRAAFRQVMQEEIEVYLRERDRGAGDSEALFHVAVLRAERHARGV